MARDWYYVKNDEEFGPISEEELLALFEQGRLDQGTPLWTDALEDWTAAGELGEMLPVERMKPRAIGLPGLAETLGRGFVVEGPQKRPWVRYFARSLDYSLFGILAGLVLSALAPGFLEAPRVLVTIGIILAAIPVEAGLLAAFGTTPGKALLRTRVRRKDGARLGFGEAFSRSFDVTVRGAGAGIPIVALFTQLLAYSRLEKQGETVWDAQGGYVVQHARTGALHYGATALIYVGLVAVMVLVSAQP